MDFIEKDAPNNSSIVVYVLVPAVTFLPSRCLATVEEQIHIDTQTEGRDL
jgi:hypothetical protein